MWIQRGSDSAPTHAKQEVASDDGSALEAEALSSGRKNKRRNKSKKKAQKPNESHAGEDEDEGKAASSTTKRAAPNQKKFYTGITADILHEAIHLARLRLYTKNAYPSLGQQFKYAKKEFDEASRTVLGSRYKGAY